MTRRVASLAKHGLRIRLVASAVGFAAFLVLANAAPPTSAAPSQDELLRIESEVTYDIRPDEGPVRVTWQVDLENNDPSTVSRDEGTVLFYESVSLPVLRGASSTQATGPGGVDLAVTVDDTVGATVDRATIVFDRGLHFGETYTLTLSYELVDTRSNALLVSDAYVYVPAIVSGDAAVVHIATPDDPAWDVTVEAVDCPPAPENEYRCGGSEYVQVAALVEVTRPDALQSISAAVALDAGGVAVSISYFPGEETWATHMRELAASALPVLEELFGFSYDGPRSLTIAERGRQEIAGYEGTFTCLADSCTIGISPVADDLIALHEFAHLWTEQFEKRWLAEGMADYLAARAADELGSLVEAAPREGSPDRVPLQLDEWQRGRYLIGASEDELAREDTGYLMSLRFFEALERQVGFDAIRATNVASTQFNVPVDSETYFDLAEEASGADLSALFLERVFAPSYVPVLEQRRAVRDRQVSAASMLAVQGFTLPRQVGDFIDAWLFDEADGALDEAEAAFDTFAEAMRRVDEPRSVWARIGLLGGDPDGALDDAADAFRAGDVERAADRAEDARSLIDGAEQAAWIRIVIAGAALALIVGGGAWLFRGSWKSG